MVALTNLSLAIRAFRFLWLCLCKKAVFQGSNIRFNWSFLTRIEPNFIMILFSRLLIYKKINFITVQKYLLMDK